MNWLKKFGSLCLAVVLSVCLLAQVGSALADDKKVTSVEVETMPNKTVYVIGEEFSAEGGTLKVTYDDGTTEIVAMTDSSVKLSKPTMKTANTKNVTATVGKKRVVFKIEVVAGMCVDVTQSREHGAAVVLKKYKKRYGLVIGFMLSVGIIAFLNDRVMMIEIGGNETISDSRIISLLEDTGISIGSRISDIDLRQAERRIKGMDKDVGWIGIRHTGSRVVVEISELTEPPEMQSKNTPCNIVASRDAQIKNVRLYSGMLVPMVGDGVKKGDIIVSGVVDTKYGRSFYVHSIGEITGIYTEKMTFSKPLECEEYVGAGTAEKKAISIFGKRFVYSSEGSVDGEYEYNEDETPLTLGKITFPVSRVDMHYHLLEKATVTRTEEEAEQLIGERIDRYEKNFITGNSEIVQRDIEKSVSNGVVTFSVTYTLEGEIGVEKQIFARYEDAQGLEKKTEENK